MKQLSESQVWVLSSMANGKQLVRSEWYCPHRYWIESMDNEGHFRIDRVHPATINKLYEASLIQKGKYMGALKWAMEFVKDETRQMFLKESE